VIHNNQGRRSPDLECIAVLKSVGGAEPYIYMLAGQVGDFPFQAVLTAKRSNGKDQDELYIEYMFHISVVSHAPWMAIQAGNAVILVITHFVMFAVHTRLAVLVAADTGETGIVAHILVAFGATVPFTPV